jgi:hypothetical protein
VISVVTGKLLSPLDGVMADFARWLDSASKGRPIFVSDRGCARRKPQGFAPWR